MSTHIHIAQHPSRTPSVESASEDDELHEPGVTVSLAGQSPRYSTIQPQSNSGSSSHHEEYVHLTYPNEELPEAPGHREVHPSDSASHLDRRDRPQHIRAESHRQETLPRRDVPLAHNIVDPRQSARARHLHEPSPIDDADSTEGFLADTEYVHQMPRPTLYHHPNGYTQSSSSGSFVYPPVHPPSNQLMHYGHPAPQGTTHAQYGHHAHHHHHPYTPASGPAPMNYPTSQPGHQALGYGPPAHVAPHYPNSYGPPQIYHAPAPQGYYPPGYAPPYQHGYPQPHGYLPHAVPPLPAFMDAWRVSPHPANASAVSSSSSDKPVIDQEELIKQMKLLMTASNAEREAKEKERQASIRTAEDQANAMRKADRERQQEEALIRAEALRAAKEQAETAARLHADRAADEARIRREATEAAEKAIAAAATAAAEQAAREAKIREEAAKAALEAAAKEAKAKAEQQEREAKIAADASAAAKSEAEKKAADEAKAAEEAAAKAKAEADQKVKEAEEAAAKAKAEAEAAQAKADAATPAEKKAPIRFKDAIGRNYNFPWERCHKWRDMEGLIVQAFQHIEDIGDHVINRRYDLIGPDKEIIMPEYWDVTIQPDMHITMMLWPLPPKPPEDMVDLGAPIDGIMNVDDILGMKKKPKKKQTSGGGFSTWMFGGPPKPRKTAKKS